MSFCVVRMTKFKRGALGGLQNHDERAVESKTNPDINYEASKENIRLLEPPNGLKEGIMSRVKSIRENSGETKKLRKDAVVAVGLLITSDSEAFEKMGKAKTHAFFAESLKFIQDRYGAANVVSATVHMDEKTPHMHVFFTPEFEGKLSAKNLFALKRKELTHLHTDFAEQVGKKYGLERGIEGSPAKHISAERFKAEEARKAREAEEKIAQELRQKVERGKQFFSPPELKGEDLMLGGRVVIKRSIIDAREDYYAAVAEQNSELDITVATVSHELRQLKDKTTSTEKENQALKAERNRLAGIKQRYDLLPEETRKAAELEYEKKIQKLDEAKKLPVYDLQRDGYTVKLTGDAGFSRPPGEYYWIMTSEKTGKDFAIRIDKGTKLNLGEPKKRFKIGEVVHIQKYEGEVLISHLSPRDIEIRQQRQEPERERGHSMGLGR